MSAYPMPRFVMEVDGSPAATWPDESDERWLIAVFLRSDLGVSLININDVLAGLDSLIEKTVVDWGWAGNGCMIDATPNSCRLQLMDRDIPPHIPVVVLPPSQLKEIVIAWKNFVLSQQSPG